jgi:hypothetical protein
MRSPFPLVHYDSKWTRWQAEHSAVQQRFYFNVERENYCLLLKSGVGTVDLEAACLASIEQSAPTGCSLNHSSICEYP